MATVSSTGSTSVIKPLGRLHNCPLRLYHTFLVISTSATNLLLLFQAISKIDRVVTVRRALEVCCYPFHRDSLSVLSYTFMSFSLSDYPSITDSSYYASSSNMRVEHYQALVDRGWRRSGHTYYKPDLTRSCCPHYTIRLDSGRFKASKSQRRALNRWNRFVLGTEYSSKDAKVCPRSREEKRKRKTRFDLEASVHASEYAKLKRPVDPKTKKRIEPVHKFEVNLESDSFSKEKWDVFLAYQTTIHKEPESKWKHESFKRFLCCGLDRKVVKSEGVTRKLGSYHQCYRLDGRLIAVAVLDTLPHGVSSVYLL